MSKYIQIPIKDEHGDVRVVTVSDSNGKYKKTLICLALSLQNKKELEELIVAKYQSGMSGPEISEWIEETTGVPYSGRSVQRTLTKAGCKLRPMQEAFKNAIDRGRVTWQLKADKEIREIKKQLGRVLRYRVLERDQFKCVLCSNGREQGTLLQVDHIIARVHGGGDDMTNLRTLCIDCNLAKRVVNKEIIFGGGFVSGKNQE